MSDEFSLKWGTLKSWHFRSDAAKAAAQRYMDAGKQSGGGAMTQHDTPEQKRALCDLIDALDAETVTNDWSGEAMTKDEAKAYVMDYGVK